MTYLDKTFCASPHCTNACGRKMNEEQRKLYLTALRISPFINLSFAYFCGEPLKDEAILADEKILKKYSKAIKNLADK